MTTATRLTGPALIAKVAEFDSTVRASIKVAACGYLKDNGQPDFVAFYEALIAAKGLNEPTEDPEMSDTEVELRERFGDGAVDAFIEVWSVDDLEGFEDAYCGEYESGAAFAEELVTDCYGIPNSFPCFVEIDWEATWQNLSYDHYFEAGHIFNANW